MKTNRFIGAILFSVTIGFSTVALATGGMGNKLFCNKEGGGMHQDGDGGSKQQMHQARMGAKLEALREDLALNSGQKEAWRVFEKRIRTLAGDKHDTPVSKTDDPLQARIARMERHLERMKGIVEAREQLLGALTPDQAKQLQSFPGGGGH